MLFGESVEDIDQFGHPFAAFRLTLLEGLLDAVIDVVSEDRQADSVERCFSSSQLLEHFHAWTGFLQHPSDPPYLAFHPVEARDERLLAGDAFLSLDDLGFCCRFHVSPFSG